jgi:predicted nucleotidyltransferase
MMDNISSQDIRNFCLRYRIVKLAVFGSSVRDDFGPDSDLDVLYEFEPGYSPGWGIVRVKNDLEILFGRKVDMVSFKYINRYLREDVLAEARILHDAA